MVFYLIKTKSGYFSGLHRCLPFFRLRAEFHWDITLESGPLKLYRTEREARNFIAEHRHLFPIDVSIKPYDFPYRAGA